MANQKRRRKQKGGTFKGSRCQRGKKNKQRGGTVQEYMNKLRDVAEGTMVKLGKKIKGKSKKQKGGSALPPIRKRGFLDDIRSSPRQHGFRHIMYHQ